MNLSVLEILNVDTVDRNDLVTHKKPRICCRASLFNFANRVTARVLGTEQVEAVTSGAFDKIAQSRFNNGGSHFACQTLKLNFQAELENAVSYNKVKQKLD